MVTWSHWARLEHNKYYLEIISQLVVADVVVVGQLNYEVIIFRSIANHSFTPSKERMRSKLML